MRRVVAALVWASALSASAFGCSERRALSVDEPAVGPTGGPIAIGPFAPAALGAPTPSDPLAPRRGAFEFGLIGASLAVDPLPPPALATLEPALAAAPDPIPGLVDDKGACPTGMALVDGESCTEVEHTCLKKMEDDPARRCLEFKPGADVCVAPKGHLRFCMDRYEWPGTPGAQPRVLVDYFEAEKLCKSVGKRMCKEDEFYLACEGPEHWPYAWGHSRHPSSCNIDRPYLMVDWVKWAKGGQAMVEEAKRLDQALPIGASKCWSQYGIHDIAGNVDEWTTARPGRELQGSLNGGYWGPVQNACRYVTTVHGPEFLFYQIGFRCCADAKA